MLRNLLIGGSVLLLTDYLGKTAGLHIPVNGGTLGVTAVLGWPGVVALAAIQKWVL
jgi:inhibitor of the pro-sigma K processing machinery